MPIGGDQPADPASRISGPSPCAEEVRRASAGVVMRFHSSIVRMKRTLPDAVDGEIEPNDGELAGDPRGHDDDEQPGAGDAADRAGSPGAASRRERHARQRSQRNASPSAAPTRKPSLRASVASPTSSPRERERAGAWPLSPRAASQSAPATSGW